MDKTYFDTAIRYIDEHMRESEICEKLEITSTQWGSWFGMKHMPHGNSRRKVKRLYEKLKFAHEVERLVKTYGPTWPNDELNKDYANYSLEEFWSMWGLWLSRDDVYEPVCGNRHGEPDPNPEDEEGDFDWTPTGYGGEVESRFEKLLRASKFLQSLDI